MAGEKIEVTERTATDASINDFLRGDEYMPGGRHDLEDRGMGSGINSPNHAPMGNAAPVAEPTFVQDAQAAAPASMEEAQANDITNAQDPDFKQRYGQEANEKGQWRRTAEEALATLQQAQAELNAMRTAYSVGGAVPGTPGAQFNGYPQATGTMQPGGYGMQQQPMPQSNIPENFFAGKDGEDLVDVATMNEVIRSQIAPAVLHVYQQQQALHQTQMQAQKAAAGITMQIEQQVTAAHPWIGAMPDGPQRVQAIVDIMRHSQQQPAQPQMQPQVPQAPQPTMTPQAAAAPAARRVTYVETASGRTSAEAQQNPQQEFAAKWANARTAFDKRKLLEEHGMTSVNDFGDPSVLTR